MNDERPTHLDLFSGIGGFSLAFESAGFRTVGFSEINPYASGVLARHWPSVPNFGDFRKVPRDYVDVITGGVPCQPASLAGKRGGENDARWLWDDAIDLFCDIRPAFGVFENVTGLLHVNGGRGFNRILSRLAARGFDAWWTTLRASHLGAWHARERVFIVVSNPEAFDGNTWNMLEAGQVRGPSQQPGRLPWMAMASGWTPGPQWFEREPRLVRLVDGVSDRTHRLECGGNSVVPQVAFIFAKAIYQILKPNI